MKTKIIIIGLCVVFMISCKNDVVMAPNEVVLSGLSYNPASLTVSLGTKVTWINNESVTHTVTSDSSLFDSGDMIKGNSFTYTFNKAGTFGYHCKFHPNMTGKIIVPSVPITNPYLVTIAGFAFSPAILTVPVGTTVTWTNNDAATHTATSKTSVFDSKDLTQGKSFSFRFTTPGTYQYICIYHSNMLGTIVVQ
jgi:plastocyanin